MLLSRKHSHIGKHKDFETSAGIAISFVTQPADQRKRNPPKLKSTREKTANASKWKRISRCRERQFSKLDIETKASLFVPTKKLEPNNSLLWSLCLLHFSLCRRVYRSWLPHCICNRYRILIHFARNPTRLLILLVWKLLENGKATNHAPPHQHGAWRQWRA